MAQKYVDPAGNDSWDGTSATHTTGSVGPWATITHAFATINSGDTLNVAVGTYIEGDGSGAMGFGRAFASTTTIQGPSPYTQPVIKPTGGSSSFGFYNAGLKNVTFKNLVFQSSASANTYLLMQMTTDCNNIIFDHCGFLGTIPGTTLCSLEGYAPCNHDITFTSCTFGQTDYSKLGIQGVTFTTGATQTLNNVTLTSCTFRTTGMCFVGVGITNLDINGCDMLNLYNGYGCKIGIDGTSGGPTCTGQVRNSTIVACSNPTPGTNGHGLLIGNGADNFSVTNNILRGYDFSLVIKGNTGVTATGNTILPAIAVSALLKSCSNVTFTGNNVVQSYAYDPAGLGAAIGSALEGTVYSHDLNVSNNNVFLFGTAAGYYLVPTEFSGSSVFDSNHFYQFGSGGLGNITVPISQNGGTLRYMLADLRTDWQTSAWTSLGANTNDANSDGRGSIGTSWLLSQLRPVQKAVGGAGTLAATLAAGAAGGLPLTTTPMIATVASGGIADISPARAAKLDYLDSSVAGVLSAVQNVQNGTFINTNIPAILERPDSGSNTVAILVCFADETGAAKNLDSGSPAITLVNDAGTSLASRLGSITNPATGKYQFTYTNSVGDSIDNLHWEVTGTVNSKLRRYVAMMQIVDTTAVSFTSTDRTTLGSILTNQTSQGTTPLGTYAKQALLADAMDALASHLSDGTITLSTAYDAAKTAASQASVDAQLSGIIISGGSTGNGSYVASDIKNGKNQYTNSGDANKYYFNATSGRWTYGTNSIAIDSNASLLGAWGSGRVINPITASVNSRGESLATLTNQQSQGTETLATASGQALQATEANAAENKDTIMAGISALGSSISSLGTAIVVVGSAVTSLAAKFTGITFLAKWLGIIAGKAADAPTLAEVRATTAGAAYDNTSMSLEAQSAKIQTIQATLETTPIKVQQPVSSSGELKLCAGDDYFEADNRAIRFGVPDSYMDLAGAVPTLEITKSTGGIPQADPDVTIQGEVIAEEVVIEGVTYSRVLVFGPMSTETSALTKWNPRSYIYRVVLTWDSPAKRITFILPTACTVLW